MQNRQRVRKFGDGCRVRGRLDSRDLASSARWPETSRVTSAEWFRGVERGGIRPDEAEAFADFFVGEVGEPDAKGARVGKRQVGFAGLGEVGEDLEEWPTSTTMRNGGVVIGKGADVALGLAAGLDHGIVPGTGAAHGLGGFFAADDTGFLGGKFKLGGFGFGFLKLLGFEDETAAFVEVNAAVAGGAVGVMLGGGKGRGKTTEESGYNEAWR
jgi:hypothetical protein